MNVLMISQDLPCSIPLGEDIGGTKPPLRKDRMESRRLFARAFPRFFRFPDRLFERIVLEYEAPLNKLRSFGGPKKGRLHDGLENLVRVGGKGNADPQFFANLIGLLQNFLFGIHPISA